MTCVPLVPLKAAARAFGDPQHVEDDNWDLKPLSLDSQPIELTGAEDRELQVVAEFVEVLGGRP